MRIKTIFFFIILVSTLQSCFVNVIRDYDGLSKTLVFNQNKKWLINNVYTDLDATQDEQLNNKILETFNKLSSGNALSIDEARKNNLLPSTISFAPDLEQLQSLKENSGFDFIVNIRTKIIKNQLASLELENPLQYSKNSAFAILEVYDLKTLKKIYYQKAYSENSLDKAKTYPEYSAEEVRQNKKEGPHFNYSAETLSIKDLKKILKDIEKNAIK